MDHYDDSAPEYHESYYRRRGYYSPLQYRQHYIEKMIERNEIPRGARILDVGCGPGELIINLLRREYDVWGVDISRAMVEEAIDLIQNHGFPGWNQAVAGDIETLAFRDGYFDVVVAAGVIEYQKDDMDTILEVARVLKGDGYFILNVTNRFSYTGLLSKPYNWLKKSAPIGRMFDLVKSRLLGKGPVSQFPDHRTHAPWRFDRTLSRNGFEKIEYNFFHFSPLPSPFCTLLSPVCNPVGNWMERLTGSPLGILGGGYLVMAKKRS